MKKFGVFIGFSITVIVAAVILLTVYHFKITAVLYPIDYEDDQYSWNAIIGASEGDVLVRGEKINEIKDDINKLVFAFNRSGKDPENFRTAENDEPALPKLKLIDLQIGIVTVEVINAQYLTQRMGTTGANAFMATATFTLTEHEDAIAVNFLFIEGDHAVPGIYTREMFSTYWVIRNGNNIDGRGKRGIWI